MKIKRILFSLTFLSFVFSAHAQRIVENMNADWTFYFVWDFTQHPQKDTVTIPHTWNANEVTSVRPYTRTAGNYEKKWFVGKQYLGKRLFLRFEGVNSTAHLFINNKLVGRHEGGYTAFCYEITDFVTINKENLITVQANNSYNLGVLPLSGDFNVYGGIHRPVSLIVTAQNCITPLDYASSGVYIKTPAVSANVAQVEVLTKFSLKDIKNLSLKTTLTNAIGEIVSENETLVNNNSISQKFSIEKPHLWNGKADPYLYQAKMQLIENQTIVDEVVQPLGLRYFHVDANKGFFLNGKYLDLHGLCRHEDMYGKGSALTAPDYDMDMQLVNEMGANTMRLAHYPYPTYFYNLCDKNGIVLWTEIPLVGPGGYSWAGYVNNPVLHLHAKNVLRELIRQNYNHPSICFWGLFNEIKLDFDNPVELMTDLDRLAKEEDPSRLTTCATFLDFDKFNKVSDLIAWNKYYGWYGGNFADIGTWADNMHALFPTKPIGISEYGAGASVYQHDDSLLAPNPSGRWHPEAWQAKFHEENWRELYKRPFLWGKYIWVMTDFGSTIRTEGDTLGMNDKGLITYDRKIKKDAFFFYKANWSSEPMLYIANRRYFTRNKNLTFVKVYSNLSQVELWVNGKSYGVKKPDEIHLILWPDVVLEKKVNLIKIKAKSGENTLADSCTWNVL